MIPMMNEYKNLIINFVKEHQKGLKIALLVFLVGGMIFKGLMPVSYTHLDVYKRQIPHLHFFPDI